MATQMSNRSRTSEAVICEEADCYTLTAKCGIGKEEIVGEFAPSLKQRGCIDLRRLLSALPWVAVTNDGILEKQGLEPDLECCTPVYPIYAY
jgi:hypothetical protein